MKDATKTEPKLVSRRLFLPYGLGMVFVSLVAIVSTYALADSALGVTAKLNGFLGIIAGFLTLSLLIHIWQTRKSQIDVQDFDQGDNQIDKSLAALDEANEFFTGVLKSADAFRLASSRISDLLPFCGIVLYLLDETRTHLKVTEVDGADTEYLKGITTRLDEALPGQAYSTKQFAIDGYLSLDPTQTFGASAAIPLLNSSEVFAVLQLFFDKDFEIDAVDPSLYDAIGNRVSPLLLSSLAFERSQENALTDATTDLPNERAFYLILENQVAEAIRTPRERTLTILAIDIKNFDDINRRFGHAAGDRVLNFVAKTIRDNVRQMDFFARAMSDEFLAILPTASKEVSYDLINRINTGFFGRRIKLNEDESLEIALNIGWATFGEDGVTPGELLNLAQLRKEQFKMAAQPNVLLFPQEFA